MGKLLLCSHELASVPYYIENIALNVYSLEEMCCYLKHNIDLVEPSFMDDELIAWIRTELKMPSLAGRLETSKAGRGGLKEFVKLLAEGCSYCGREEIEGMQLAVADFENKSETECKKIRADRLLQKKRYGACIKEYNKILGFPEVRGMLAGNIYHNLGTAYAGLFFFREAADCFGKAYERNRNPLSFKQQQMAQKLAEGMIMPVKAAKQDEMRPDEQLERFREEYLINCK